MPHLRSKSESADRRALQVDVKLFQLALRSYPELFRREPSITFEQHFLSLVASAQSKVHPPSPSAR